MELVDASMFEIQRKHKYCENTGKRSYKSVTHARAANRQASFRMRAYICEDCGNYHICNEEKR